MAIPHEHPTSRIQYLKKKFEIEFGSEFNSLLAPTDRDFELFGRYIQMFAMIEINLRNAVEVFFRADLLNSDVKKKWHKLASSELIPSLIQGAQKMGSISENIPETVGKLKEIEFRRSIRNLLAHWAIMRIPDEDAIVLFSKDGRDEKQISGDPHVEHNYMRTAYLDLPDIRGLLIHIDAYGLWLAHKASEWRNRYLPDDFL